MATAIKNPLTKDTLRKWMLENGGNILYDPIHPGVFTGYVTITPERAAAMLETNVKNRKLGLNRQVPQLKKDITNGKWNDNVSKINFTKNTTLSDGQNRIYSAQSTGKTIRCIVTWGVDDEAQLVTDRRGTRSLPDDLQIAGVKNARSIANIGRICYLRSHGVSINSLITKGAAVSSTPDNEIFHFVMDNLRELETISKRADSIYHSLRPLGVNNRIVTILSLSFNEISEDDSNTFWEKLSKGKGLDADDPIYLLRDRLFRNANKNTEKMPDKLQAALIIKAWNFYMKGEKLKQLKYTVGGATPEPFPEIYNPYEMD